eukprot:470767-Ditylum_brightwellii.AAC.1
MKDKFLHEKVWHGQMLYPLERLIRQHRVAFIAMKEMAEHVPFHLPNKFMRVGFLLAGISSNDAGCRLQCPTSRVMLI